MGFLATSFLSFQAAAMWKNDAVSTPAAFLVRLCKHSDCDCYTLLCSALTPKRTRSYDFIFYVAGLCLHKMSSAGSKSRYIETEVHLSCIEISSCFLVSTNVCTANYI